MKSWRAPLAAMVVLSASVVARADHVSLRDGRLFEGIPVVKDGEALVLTFPSGNVRVPLDLVAEYAIDGVEPEPATEEEKARRAQGLVPWKGKWVKIEIRDRERAKEKAKRDAELAEWKKRSEWKDRYQFKTKNFNFESTLPPHLNEEYSTLLEAYFVEFAKKWKTRVPQEWGRLTVCFHSDPESYQRTAGVSSNVLGYYRFVHPRELNFYFDRTNPSLTVDVMLHETNHYLTDLMHEEVQYPHWVNEAMAEYYGTTELDPEKKTMTLGGIQAGRLSEVKADIAANKKFALDDLLADGSQNYRHYTWGWSFVHFLMESPKYVKKFEKFFNDLARAPDVKRVPAPWNFKTIDGPEIKRVFLQRMGLKPTDIPALEAEWYAHIDSLKAEGIAGIEESGIRAVYEGRGRFRGRRLLKEAIDAGSRRPQVHILYAQIIGRYDGGNEAALPILEAASTTMPLDAEIWAHRGFLLKLMERAREGDQFLALAREIDPEVDLIQIEVMLAMMASVKDQAE
jgi:hypothetical protein